MILLEVLEDQEKKKKKLWCGWEFSGDIESLNTGADGDSRQLFLWEMATVGGGRLWTCFFPLPPQGFLKVPGGMEPAGRKERKLDRTEQTFWKAESQKKCKGRGMETWDFIIIFAMQSSHALYHCSTPLAQTVSICYCFLSGHFKQWGKTVHTYMWLSQWQIRSDTEAWCLFLIGSCLKTLASKKFLWLHKCLPACFHRNRVARGRGMLGLLLFRGQSCSNHPVWSLLAWLEETWLEPASH